MRMDSYGVDAKEFTHDDSETKHISGGVIAFLVISILTVVVVLGVVLYKKRDK